MSSSNAPKWFWFAAGLLFVWNLMGLAAFFYEGMITDEVLAQMPEAQRKLYEVRPGWVVGAFAVATTSGTAASIALLMRRAIATPLFLVSLVGVLVQDSWMLVSDVIAVMGTQAIVMPVLVILSIVGGILLSRKGIAEGWIR